MNQQPNPDRVILQLRVILGAMTSGIVGISLVAVLVVRNQPPPSNEQLTTILLAVMCGLALTEIPVYVLVRTTRVSGLRTSLTSKPDAERLTALCREYSTLTIIAAAMAEAVGLLGGLAHLLTAHTLALLGPVASLAVFFALFPSKQRLRNLAVSILGLTPGSRLVP